MHRSLVSLALALAALAAHAHPEELPFYDPSMDAKQRAVVRLFIRTRVCLGDAARAIMRQGVREPAVVQHFMASMCGEHFVIQLKQDGMSDERARQTVVELTQKVLYEDVLRQPIPSKPSN